MIVPEGLEDGSSGTERSTRHLAADLMKKELDVFFRLKDPALQLEYEIFNFTNQSQSSLLIITVLTTFLMIPLWILGGVGMLQEPFHHHVYIWAGTLFVLLIVGVLLWVLYFRIESWLKVCDQGHVPAAKQRASVRTWLQVLFIIYTTLVCIRLFVRIQHGGDCHHSVMVSNSWECNPYASINAVPSDSAAMVMVMPLLYTMITRGADFRFAMLLLVLTAGVFIAATLVLHSNLFLTMLCSYLIFGATIIVEAKRQSLSVFFLHQQLERSIQAREKAVDEDIITEMRHMIANIAHDLKTVRQPLLCCTRVLTMSLASGVVSGRHGVHRAGYSRRKSTWHGSTAHCTLGRRLAVHRCLCKQYAEYEFVHADDDQSHFGLHQSLARHEAQPQE